MMQAAQREGRYREVTPPERFVWTSEWDGMPGYVAVDTGPSPRRVRPVADLERSRNEVD
jgi:hypothetical protein